MRISAEFKPLEETDFSSAEEFQAFRAAKEHFVEWQSRSVAGNDFGDLQRSPAIESILSQPNEVLKSRMTADLIHSEGVPEITQLTLAGRFFFNNSVKEPATVPSVETLALLKQSLNHVYTWGRKPSQQNHDVQITDYMLTNSRVEMLQQTLGTVSYDDQEKIIALENRYGIKDEFSIYSESAVAQNLAANFATTPYSDQLPNFKASMDRVTGWRNDVSGMAKLLRDQNIHHAPGRYARTESDHLQNAKKDVYVNLVQDGFERMLQPTDNQDPAAQQADFKHRTNQMLRLSRDDAEALVERPDLHLKGIRTLVEQRDALGFAKPGMTGLGGSWDINRQIESIFDGFKNSVKTSIQREKITASDGVAMLLDGRSVYPECADEGHDENVQISSTIREIVENASTDEALKIYRIYQEKMPGIPTKNSNDKHVWDLTADASRRLRNARTLDAMQKQEMMTAMLDLEEMNIHRNGDYSDDARTAFAAGSNDDKKLFLKVMVDKNYPSSSSSDIVHLVTDAKASNDPTILEASLLVATKAAMNDVIGSDSQSEKDAAIAILGGVYAKHANKSGLPLMREMVRQYGEQSGLQNEQINEVLQGLRGAYKKEHGLFAGLQESTASLFQKTKDSLFDIGDMMSRPTRELKL